MKDAPIAQSNYSKVQTGICKSPKIMCCNGRRYHFVKPYVYYWCGDSLNPFGHCWFRQREGPEINWRPLGVTRHYLRMLYSIACVSYCGTDGITLFFQSCFLSLSLSFCRFHVVNSVSFVQSAQGIIGCAFSWPFIFMWPDELATVRIGSHVIKYCLACHWDTRATVLVAAVFDDTVMQSSSGPSRTAHLKPGGNAWLPNNGS